MGNCGLHSDNFDPTVSLNKSQFNFCHPIGKGGFGQVWKVHSKKDNKVYAMKQMLKLRIATKRSVYSVMNQRRLLQILRHPFMVNMNYAFQDRDNLYLILDYLQGGDLRYQFTEKGSFSQQQTKFFAGCIILILEYLHSNGIIHRDIKPENLIFNSKGYLKLTDFGTARFIEIDNSNQTSGTPGYMAPEVLCRQCHGPAVDYFALGVILYECIKGSRPYYGRNRQQMRERVLQRQVMLTKSDMPDGWSNQSIDFVNKLIQRRPASRLGFNGALEVKKHIWFEQFSWEKLFLQQMDAPFVPQEKKNFDENQVESEWNDQELLKTIKKNSVVHLFAEYGFDRACLVNKQEDLKQYVGLCQ